MKRAIILIGVVLALAGLMALLHPDFTYHEKKQVAQIGPMKATVDEEKTATVPMGVSVLLIVAGGGLALFGSRKRKPSAA